MFDNFGQYFVGSLTHESPKKKNFFLEKVIFIDFIIS